MSRRPLLSRLPRRRTPVVLVAGVDEPAVLGAAMSVQLGLPRAVSVRHTIDLDTQALHRVVSDVTGVVERERIDLAHACVDCAVREDVVPTLQRLAASGRWDAVVACLPLGAEPTQVCRVLAWGPRTAPDVSVAAVVTALDGRTVVEDLLGEDLVGERGIATSEDDDRGVAEVACAMVEYADVVCLTEVPDPDELALLRVLARPHAALVTDPAVLQADRLVAGVHRHETVESWVAEVRRGELPPLPAGGVWRLDLGSDRPFHPVRFHDELPVLGGGPRRSRGCFWLPTRADAVCAWDAAGGRASIGSTRDWAGTEPTTRITVVGLDDGSADVAAAFDRCLLTDAELASRGRTWPDTWDGLEPWLGPVDHVA